MRLSTNTNTNQAGENRQMSELPKRVQRYFSFLIMSYVFVGLAAGLYLVVSAATLNIELTKFIQYPIATPMLVTVFVSFLILYICIMIREHLQRYTVLYKEDIYLLRLMMITQVLLFNYFSLIPTVLLYLNLRKNNAFSSEKYPAKGEQNKFIPVMTEGTFYVICFTLLGMMIIFGALLFFAYTKR